MNDLIDLGNFIAEYLRKLGPVPVDAGTLARVVVGRLDDAFLTIPRGEITDVEHEYALPRELVEDAAAIDTVHDWRLAEAMTEALRNGLVVIEMPTRHELPRLRPDPMNMVRFKLVARARKIAPSGEHAPGPHHPAADGGPGAPS